MTKGSPQSTGVDSKNPLLRKMAQLELAERQKMRLTLKIRCWASIYYAST